MKQFAPFFFLLICLGLSAQEQPNVQNNLFYYRTLRYRQLEVEADTIIQQVIANKNRNNYTRQPYFQFDFYQKTSVEWIMNQHILQNQVDGSAARNDVLYKQIIRPFGAWFQFFRPTPEEPDNLAMTILKHEEYSTMYADKQEKNNGAIYHASQKKGFLETIGQENIACFFDAAFGEIDLYRNKVEIMSLSFISPLSDNALQKYSYRLKGETTVRGIPCYEIVFYGKSSKENVFAGCLYISKDGNYSLLKAQFTLNNSDNMNYFKDILITHYFNQKQTTIVPVQKQSVALLGNELDGYFQIERNDVYTGFSLLKPCIRQKQGQSFETGYKERDETYWQQVRPIPLTPAQTQLDSLLITAYHTAKYKQIQNALSLLLNNHVTVGGMDGVVELGPLTQFVSYNSMEGLRLRVGGNTTLKLFDRLTLGGYAAYGTTDGKWKGRADLAWSLLPRDRFIWEYPKRLISFSFVNDLNIPGQDLLTNTRDNIVYSFSHASTNNMSLQRMGILTFENEQPRHFSYMIGGKYLSDNPQGVVRYMQALNGETTIVNQVSTAELLLSIRFSPGEKFIRNRNKRLFIRRGDIELNLNHRVGMKGILGSDYNYQITHFSAYKKIPFGRNYGNIDLYFQGGKVWNRVPFPLLFIPQGNHSYVFETTGYNCMNFYEFTTDRFLAGNINLMFNWSPFQWIDTQSKIKTSIGSRAIYGSLSDHNNPMYHPELFVFNEGIRPLENMPYVEVNIGLANIFKMMRIEYVRRLTYLDESATVGGHKVLQGALLVTGIFLF